jgi:hypothetical protein
MAVYALYIPTAKRPVSGVGLERFPSREVTGRILLQRNNTGRSRTFYVTSAKVSWIERPEEEFPLADETGYMRVFLRRSADSVPDLLDTPDEEWVVREGGKRGVVQRLRWAEGQEKLTIADKRLKIVPAPPAPPPLDLRNRFFGNWLVLWRNNLPSGPAWYCVCTCGCGHTSEVVLEVDLVSGRSKRHRTIEPEPDYEVRTPVTVKPDVPPCASCFVVPSVTGRCNCS